VKEVPDQAMNMFGGYAFDHPSFFMAEHFAAWLFNDASVAPVQPVETTNWFLDFNKASAAGSEADASPWHYRDGIFVWR
jgi:hypothetical protein